MFQRIECKITNETKTHQVGTISNSMANYENCTENECNNNFSAMLLADRTKREKCGYGSCTVILHVKQFVSAACSVAFWHFIVNFESSPV